MHEQLFKRRLLIRKIITYTVVFVIAGLGLSAVLPSFQKTHEQLNPQTEVSASIDAEAKVDQTYAVKIVGRDQNYIDYRGYQLFHDLDDVDFAAIKDFNNHRPFVDKCKALDLELDHCLEILTNFNQEELEQIARSGDSKQAAQYIKEYLYTISTLTEKDKELVEQALVEIRNLKDAYSFNLYTFLFSLNNLLEKTAFNNIRADFDKVAQAFESQVAPTELTTYVDLDQDNVPDDELSLEELQAKIDARYEIPYSEQPEPNLQLFGNFADTIKRDFYLYLRENTHDLGLKITGFYNDPNVIEERQTRIHQNQIALDKNILKLIDIFVCKDELSQYLPTQEQLYAFYHNKAYLVLSMLFLEGKAVFEAKTLPVGEQQNFVDFIKYLDGRNNLLKTVVEPMAQIHTEFNFTNAEDVATADSEEIITNLEEAAPQQQFNQLKDHFDYYYQLYGNRLVGSDFGTSDSFNSDEP